MDLQSIDAKCINIDDAPMQWITPYSEYEFITQKTTDELIKIVNTIDGSRELMLSLNVKLGDILIDVSRIFRIATDLCNFNKIDASPVYDKSISRVTDTFFSNNLNVSEYMKYYWRRPIFNNKSSVHTITFRRIQRFYKVLFNKEKQIDILAPNTLLSEYVELNSINSMPIYAYHYYGIKPISIPKESYEIINYLIDRCMAVCPISIKDDKHIVKRIRIILHDTFAWHLNQSFSDIKYFDKRKLYKSMGKVLIGGTPKYLGRLMSAFYKEYDRSVYRFAHGGERGLYNDKSWALYEFPYCDKYFVHGKREKELITNRLASNQLKTINKSNPIIDSLGSKKHQNILSSSRRKVSNKKIMYVPGPYHDEWAAQLPSFRPPDPLMYEWQIWMLKTLKKHGYNVSVKTHPKGRYFDKNLLGSVCSETIDGFFNPNEIDVESFIFDFSGTAFMDALASYKNIIYLDLGIRPFDENAIELFSNRVQCITCHFDEFNRFRVEKEKLIEAIELSFNENSYNAAEHFVNEYFSI